MKRRSFIKKSTAAAIVAVTPMALTGLVNAEGGGGNTTNTETTWFTDTTDTTGTQTTEFFTETTMVSTYEDAECSGFEMRYDAGANNCWSRWSCRFADGTEEIRYGVNEPCPTIEEVFNNPSLLSQLQRCMGFDPELMPSMGCVTGGA